MFSALEAKLLKPGASLLIPECPGLRLERTPTVGRDTLTWVYRYRSPVDQKVRQTKLGRWPAVSVGKAMTEWDKLSSARNSGQDIAGEQRTVKAAKKAAAQAAAAASKAGPTVRAIVERYLDRHVDTKRAAAGAADVRRMLTNRIGPIADLVAQDLTRREASALLELYEHTPVVCGKLRAELGGAWDRALDAGLLPESTRNYWRTLMHGMLKSKGRPVAGKSPGKPVKRYLTEEELAVLIPWLPNFSRTICDALTLYLWTATRGAEFLQMEGKEVTEEADGLWWTCPKIKTKNSNVEEATDLRVPLVGRAEVVVRRRMALYPEGRYLFPSSPKTRVAKPHIEQVVVRTAVYRHMPYAKDALAPLLPVIHWAPHDLRRSSRTLLARLECPDEIGEAITGHIKGGVKGVYNQYQYDAERRRWLTTLSDRLEALATRSAGAASSTPAAARPIPSPRARATPRGARLTLVA